MPISEFATWLAAGMAWVLAALPTRDVNLGYFRSSVLVTLGLLVVAILSGWSGSDRWLLALLGLAAATSYLDAVAWQLERTGAGKVLLIALAILLVGVLILQAHGAGEAGWLARVLSSAAGAALLGSSLCAMLLGHYYLTAPWMSLTPLRRLVIAILISCALRLTVAGATAAGLVSVPAAPGPVGTVDLILYYALRWVLGVAGPAILAVLVWQTLKLKATQAATGILYVVVIFAMIGEATGVAMRRLGGFL